MFTLSFQVKSLRDLLQAEEAIQARAQMKLVLPAQGLGKRPGQGREGVATIPVPMTRGRGISPGKAMGSLAEALDFPYLRGVGSILAKVGPHRLSQAVLPGVQPALQRILNKALEDLKRELAL